MMRVVDTSVWVETLVGGVFGRRLQADLPEDDDWLMPTIVQLESSNGSVASVQKTCIIA